LKFLFLSNLTRNYKLSLRVRAMVMVFNTTFNNISVILWRPVLLVEETRVPRENHSPVASHWQTLSHNVVSSTPQLSGIRTYNFSGNSSLRANPLARSPGQVRRRPPSGLYILENGHILVKLWLAEISNIYFSQITLSWKNVPYMTTTKFFQSEIHSHCHCRTKL